MAKVQAVNTFDTNCTHTGVELQKKQREQTNGPSVPQLLIGGKEEGGRGEGDDEGVSNDGDERENQSAIQHQRENGSNQTNQIRGCVRVMRRV